ncbi:MAG TPA: hypothetical protein VGI80_04295 [Pyrinomonadaceae bacterium]|jgi:hypothetical protein
MPSTATWSGRILVLIGIVGYAWGYFNPPFSYTSLIPAGFGVALMLLGHLSVMVDSMRKHFMHIAVVIGLLGFLAALGGLFRKGLPTMLSAGVISQIAMALVCLAFVVLAVRSFIAARRERIAVNS